MTILYKAIRQQTKSALVTFDIADLPASTFVPLVDLPANALVVSGEVIVEVASDTVTTDVLDVGTSGAPNANLNDANFKAVGRTAFSSNGARGPRTTLGITRTPVGGAGTVGSGMLRVEYVLLGAGTETEG